MRKTASFLGFLVILAAGCDSSGPPTAATSQEPTVEKSGSAPASPANSHQRLQDVASQLGIVFHQSSGAEGNHAYPEIMFGGACVADFNSDGWPDLYLPQGGRLSEPIGAANALLINKRGRFEPTKKSGPVSYTMGAFAGDVDHDGDLDLLLTNAGSLQLLKNDGQARFTDATEALEIPNRNGLWLNAVIMDLDQDGFNDIYVANYMDWTPDKDIPCSAPSGDRDYCNPTNYSGEQDLLLKGSADGVMVDVTEVSGIGAAATRSMGVAVFDADADGDLDIYVANDGEANLLWINQGDGTYKDEAMIRGAAVNSAGKPEASMGVACADIDGDGDEDLILTHLEQETHTVYRNDGGFFADATVATGIGAWSRPDTGFGIELVDIDNDQRLDLFVANGAVARPTRPDNERNVYAQPDRLAMGSGEGLFPAAGSVDTEEMAPVVSRGTSVGDLDQDGIPEIIVAVKDGPVRVLRLAAQLSQRNHWIALRPVSKSNAAAEVGCQVKVLGHSANVATLRPHRSYLGSGEHLVRIGLGPHDQPVSAIVRWLDGTMEQYDDLAVDQTHRVVRGEGTNVDAMAFESAATVALAPTKKPDRTAASDTASAESATPARVADLEVGPIPSLAVEPEGKYGKRASLDIDALTAWCKSAGLPKPPQAKALDASTWELVHSALERAARKPTAKNLGELGMLYDGHNVGSAAIELYRRAVTLDKTEPKWRHLLGRALMKNGDVSSALEAFKQAETLNPNSAPTKARLAETYLASGNAEKAVETWRSYLELRLNDAAGLGGLAQSLESAGQLQEALETAQQILKQKPKARQATLLAARVAARLGSRELAEKYNEAAKSLDKSNDVNLTDNFDNEMLAFSKSVSFLRKASMHYKNNGDFAKALPLAKDLAERRPDEAQNWQLLVWLSSVTQQHDEAARYAKIAVDLDPTFAPGWDTLARSHLKKGEHASGLEMANRALKANPGFAKALASRGLALGKLQRYAEALPALDKALRANPRDFVVWQMRVACLANSGKTKEALTTLDKMTQLFPGQPWPRKMKAQLSKTAQ